MEEYCDAVRAFAEAVEQLQYLERGDFVRRYAESEQARAACENARCALEQHVAEHACNAAGGGLEPARDFSPAMFLPLTAE